MLFDAGFFDIFKGCICEQKLTLNLKKLQEFYEKLQSKFNRQKISENIFYLYGGSLQNIEKNTFANNVKFVIWNIGKIFTSKNNFINRNFKLIKKENP